MSINFTGTSVQRVDDEPSDSDDSPRTASPASLENSGKTALLLRPYVHMRPQVQVQTRNRRGSESRGTDGQLQLQDSMFSNGDRESSYASSTDANQWFQSHNSIRTAETMQLLASMSISASSLLEKCICGIGIVSGITAGVVFIACLGLVGTYDYYSSELFMYGLYISCCLHDYTWVILFVGRRHLKPIFFQLLAAHRFQVIQVIAIFLLFLCSNLLCGAPALELTFISIGNACLIFEICFSLLRLDRWYSMNILSWVFAEAAGLLTTRGLQYYQSLVDPSINCDVRRQAAYSMAAVAQSLTVVLLLTNWVHCTLQDAWSQNESELIILSHRFGAKI